MSLVQPILAYATLAVAVGYILFKFFIPKSVLDTRKRSKSACGENDCGCH